MRKVSIFMMSAMMVLALFAGFIATGSAQAGGSGQDRGRQPRLRRYLRDRRWQW